MSILSSNRTRSTLVTVAPLLSKRTLAALKAARQDRLSTRAGHVGFGGINFVVDTPGLPVGDVSFERVLAEEFRDGVRVQLERRRGDRILNIDLVIRQTWAFTWFRGYTIAATASRDFCFVPKRGSGPAIEIRDGALQRCARGFGDRDRVLSLEAGDRFLYSLMAGH
jgi:hypothetical protein